MCLKIAERSETLMFSDLTQNLYGPAGQAIGMQI